ncbi:MAG: hypothetical protein K2L10_04990 [Ruminococcus sp.]|nr:hypothetical protein [Ruminococcus sp.]
MEYIFYNIKDLITPVGNFSVYYEDKKIPFSVIRNNFDIPYGEINISDTYYILISTSDLEIGSVYRVVFSCGEWEFEASDEHTYCYCSVIENWAVGIGAYDPNDDEKIAQIFQYSKLNSFNTLRCPDKYDESKFISHIIEPLPENNGYSFRMLDKSQEDIQFPVAWIEINEYSAETYKNALGFWLT